MRVLKVVAEGMTTSFRYPHFVQGVHPSFEMPPPATIYGHMCSTLGEWVAPEGVEFAYHFTCLSQFDDLEHVHILAAPDSLKSKLPGSDVPCALQGAVNPFRRALLFRPRLVLYVNRPEWEPAFRSPHYAVVLGRSQDLFTYVSVGTVDLPEADQAYFEHTIAPYQMALRGATGYVVLMPRFLDYENGRAPRFARYLVLNRRVHTRDLWRFENDASEHKYWVDPEAPQRNGDSMGLMFHSFVGAYDDGATLAGLAR